MSLLLDENIQQLLDQNYNSIPLEKKQILYSLFQNKDTREDLKRILTKIIFKIPPPTPEQFLDPKEEWLSQKVIDSIYPVVKQQFIDILKADPPNYKVCLYGATRLGKSFLARLLMIYTIIFFHCLREPALYYGVSPLTELAIYLISFKFDKTRQIYLQPLYKILQSSKRFVKVDNKDKVLERQEKEGPYKIVWSKSATTGEITLSSGLQIQLGNDDALSFIGADALQAYISEISYFIEYAGATEERIYRIYTDISERIEATVGNKFLAFTYLDTSANYADSLIEKHIIEKLQFEPKVYFQWNARWDVRPHLYPIWQKTGKTFKVITGNGNIPAKKVNNIQDLENIPSDLIINVPIDLEKRFEDPAELIRSIKNIAGRPTSNENKFINDTKYINFMFDNPTLKNIEGIVLAEASDLPSELLWEKLKNIFFSKQFNGKYIINRAFKEPRYFGIDTAYSLKGDVMGFCMLHKEWIKEKKETIYVVDFCFPIGAEQSAINLDAPFYFIVDIIKNANVYVKGVFADTFESESQRQFLERHGVIMKKQSVDTDLSPYQLFLTCLSNQLIKSGKNIFLKNNLTCLVRTRNEGKKEKIDHPKGTTNNRYIGDWETSTCGLFAKDVSDAVCQALFGAYNDDYLPTTCYEDENAKHTNEKINTYLENNILKLQKKL